MHHMTKLQAPEDSVLVGGAWFGSRKVRLAFFAVVRSQGTDTIADRTHTIHDSRLQI